MKPNKRTLTDTIRAAETVDIRPGVSVLGVLRHLNYKPWYALAEFVDNSVESFVRHRAALRDVDGQDMPLVVAITAS